MEIEYTKYRKVITGKNLEQFTQQHKNLLEQIKQVQQSLNTLYPGYEVIILSNEEAKKYQENEPTTKSAS